MTSITMENHNFSWEKPLVQWPFSIAMLNYQRVKRTCQAFQRSGLLCWCWWTSGTRKRRVTTSLCDLNPIGKTHGIQTKFITDSSTLGRWAVGPLVGSCILTWNDDWSPISARFCHVFRHCSSGPGLWVVRCHSKSWDPPHPGSPSARNRRRPRPNHNKKNTWRSTSLMNMPMENVPERKVASCRIHKNE